MTPRIQRPAPDFSRERAFGAGQGALIAGIDEAGRGPLAGPVTAAAVILDPAHLPDGINDSKKLSAGARERLFAAIMETALAVAISHASTGEIAAFNIRGATLRVMARATRALNLLPVHALIDGRDVPPGLPCPGTAIIAGDAKSLSIAAASIIAKVSRDALMARLDAFAPGYGFAAHAGYGTKAHLAAIARLGPSPFHRLTFAPFTPRKVPPARLTKS